MDRITFKTILLWLEVSFNIRCKVFNYTVFPIYQSSLKYTNNNFISGMIGGIVVTPLVYFLIYLK